MRLTRKFSSVIRAVERRADKLGWEVPEKDTIIHAAMLICALNDRPCSYIKTMNMELVNLLQIVDYDLAIINKSKFKLEGDTLYLLA